MGLGAAKRSRRWTADQVALLLELDREAGGLPREVVRLAAGRLDKSDLAIRAKRYEMGLSMKSEKQGALSRARAQIAALYPRVIPLEEAPPMCPDCHGRWRLEGDPEAGRMLVCWACCRVEYVC